MRLLTPWLTAFLILAAGAGEDARQPNPYIDIRVPGRLLTAVNRAIDLNRKIEKYDALAAKGNRPAERQVKRFTAMRDNAVKQVEVEIKRAARKDETEIKKYEKELDRLRRKLEAAGDNEDRVAKVEKDIEKIEFKIDALAETGAAYRMFVEFAKGNHPEKTPFSLIGLGLPDLEGKAVGSDAKVTTNDFGGKAAIIMFFAVENDDSLKALRDMSDVQRLFKGKAVLIAVSVDDDAEAGAKFVAQKRPKFPVIHDADGKLRAKYFVKFLPQAVLAELDGTVKYVQIGNNAAAKTDFRNAIRDMLKAAEE